MKCFVCDKEIEEYEDFEYFDLDGDKIHKKCKTNINQKMAAINNMSNGQFVDWISGKEANNE